MRCWHVLDKGIHYFIIAKANKFFLIIILLILEHASVTSTHELWISFLCTPSPIFFLYYLLLSACRTIHRKDVNVIIMYMSRSTFSYHYFYTFMRPLQITWSVRPSSFICPYELHASLCAFTYSAISFLDHTLRIWVEPHPIIYLVIAKILQ